MNVDKFGRYTYTGMTIDKFGRHQSRERLRGPKGEGFKLTDDGNYDIENKKLVNVLDPSVETDCANLRTVQSELSACIKSNNNGIFDAQNKRISNVEDPENSNDAATKGYVNAETPAKLRASSSYSFHNYKLKDVGSPEEDGDAVNLGYVEVNTLLKSEGHFNANNNRITKLAKPLDMDDAVSKRYLKTILSDFAYEVYKITHKGRTTLAYPDEWKEKVMEASWEALFNENVAFLLDQL